MFTELRNGDNVHLNIKVQDESTPFAKQSRKKERDNGHNSIKIIWLKSKT